MSTFEIAEDIPPQLVLPPGVSVLAPGSPGLVLPPGSTIGAVVADPVAPLPLVRAASHTDPVPGRPARAPRLAHPAVAARARHHDRGAGRGPAAALGPKDGSRVGDAARGLLQRPGALTGAQPRPGGASNLTLGRDVHPSHQKVVDAITAPGLVLRRTLPLAQLVDGANTLTVSVLGARPGQRLDRVTTFVALPPSTRAPAVGMPERFVLDIDALPQALRETADLLGIDPRVRPGRADRPARDDTHWVASRSARQSRLDDARQSQLRVAARRLEGLRATRRAVADRTASRTHRDAESYR
jgi:hypothetical protein